MANFGNSPRTMATSSQRCKRGQTQQSLWILSGRSKRCALGKSEVGKEIGHAGEEANGGDLVLLGLRHQRADQVFAATRLLARGIDSDGANFGEMLSIKM